MGIACGLIIPKILLMKHKYHVLIPCAGSGSRFGNSLPKQYHQLVDKTILDWTLQSFLSINPSIIESISVVHNADDKNIENYIQNYPQVNFIAKGGDSRAKSVLNGLLSLDGIDKDNDWVMVHDAARCLIDSRDVISLIEYVEINNVGAILATGATDTIKYVDTSSMQIKQTIDRTSLYLAQTPQLYKYSDLVNSLLNSDLSMVTDESSAIELSGLPSHVVLAKHLNFKITYPQDTELAEIVLKNRV